MQRLLHLVVLLFISINLLAKAPNKMTYQAVIRNASNNLVVNSPVKMKISILQGSANGTAVFSELHNPTTNANGLVSIEIGGGIPITGTFPGINWANGPYFIKTETDPTGGTNYTISGTSQLLSVPYALYAGNVVNNGGKPILYIQGDITNTLAQAKITAELGPNTQQIWIRNTSALTALDLSMVTSAVQIEIFDNENLQSINLSKLESCGDISIGKCPKLNLLNLSSLKQLSFLNIGSTALTSIALNALSSNSNTSFEIDNNPVLTSFSVPNLTKSREIYLFINNALTSVSLPMLQTAEVISLSSNINLGNVNFQSLKSVNSLSLYSSAIASVSFPALTSAGRIQIDNNPNLASIQLQNLSVLLEQNDPYTEETYFTFFNNKLPTSQINSLLNKLVNLTPAVTGAYIRLNGQTPLAPPTGQGLTDRATLISRGNTVETD